MVGLKIEFSCRERCSGNISLDLSRLTKKVTLRQSENILENFYFKYLIVTLYNLEVLRDKQQMMYA